MKFKDYKLKDFLNKGLDDIGFIKPTLVQESVIPILLDKKSIIAKSETGTGKTHSFLIPLLQEIDIDKNEVQVVIISPTRELANQLFGEVNKLLKYEERIDARCYVGGTNRDSEIKRLEVSMPHIIVGTIGKLYDLIKKQNVLKVFTANTVVIDEADMVFSDKEADLIDEVFSSFENNIQYAVFSATVSQELQVFMHKYIRKCDVIDLSANNIMKKGIEYIFIPTKSKDKKEFLLKILASFNPYLVLIFANTKVMVKELAHFLGENNIKNVILSGDLEPRERKQVLRRIKNGEIQYVVASDIAARGIDIEGVSHVINFELPKDIEYFVHRVGRTARYDFSGTSISFYDYEDDKYLELLRKKGLECTYMDLIDGSLKVTTRRNGYRKSGRVKRIEEDVHLRTPMPKKVKPGYKKKRKEKIDKKLRQMKRQKIDQMFFKNIHKSKKDK